MIMISVRAELFSGLENVKNPLIVTSYFSYSSYIAQVFVLCSDHLFNRSHLVCRVPTNMSTQAPTFTQPLQSVVALEGSAATFEAQVSGKKLSDSQFKCQIYYHNLFLMHVFVLKQL